MNHPHFPHDSTPLPDGDGHLRYLLTAYLFGNLSDEGVDEVEAHLGDCAECRAELDDLRGTLALVEDALLDDDLFAGIGPDGEGDDATKEVPLSTPYSFEAHRLERVLAAGRARRFDPNWRLWRNLAAAVVVFLTGFALLIPLGNRAHRALAPDASVANRAEIADFTTDALPRSEAYKGLADSESSIPMDDALGASGAAAAPITPREVSGNDTDGGGFVSFDRSPPVTEARRRRLEETKKVSEEESEVPLEQGAASNAPRPRDTRGEWQSDGALIATSEDLQRRADFGRVSIQEKRVERTPADNEAWSYGVAHSIEFEDGGENPPVLGNTLSIVPDQSAGSLVAASPAPNGVFSVTPPAVDPTAPTAGYFLPPAETATPSDPSLGLAWNKDMSAGQPAQNQRDNSIELGRRTRTAELEPTRNPQAQSSRRFGAGLARTPIDASSTPPSAKPLATGEAPRRQSPVEGFDRFSFTNPADAQNGFIDLPSPANTATPTPEATEFAKRDARSDQVAAAGGRITETRKAAKDEFLDKEIPTGESAVREYAGPPVGLHSPSAATGREGSGAFSLADDRPPQLAGREAMELFGEEDLVSHGRTAHDTDTSRGFDSNLESADDLAPWAEDTKNVRSTRGTEVALGEEYQYEEVEDAGRELRIAGERIARGRASARRVIDRLEPDEESNEDWDAEEDSEKMIPFFGRFASDEFSDLDERRLRAYAYYRALDPSLDRARFLSTPLTIPAPEVGDEGLGREGFRDRFGVNPFVETSRDAQSTFAMDVDTASYTRALSVLASGSLPDPSAVRTEEFVNAFPDPRPASPDRAFSVFVEGGPAPFGGRSASGVAVEQIQVTVKARTLAAAERRPVNLTFAIDTSGSMEIGERLRVVRTALETLLANLSPDDRVGIVAYGTQAYLALPHTSARERERILDSLDALTAMGSTNVEAGLDLAYRIADEVAHPRAISRVVLCSDGVATSGARSAEEILETVRVYADRGIYLSVIGFGKERYDDAFLEQLANRGNGNYSYVDTPADAARVFRDNLPAALSVLARDAKIQVEFDPEVVSQYRLLGYENRDVADADFRNDAIDAGEVGPGSTVTAIYEVVRRPASSGDLGRVYLRYHDTTLGRVDELDFPVPPGVVATSLDATTDRFRLLASVAEFAELLRGSYFARDGALAAVLGLLDSLSPAARARDDVHALIDSTERALELSVEQWSQ